MQIGTCVRSRGHGHVVGGIDQGLPGCNFDNGAINESDGLGISIKTLNANRK